ncbi:MAG: hypothetical protein JJV97_01140 [SAR324 cluster bacterium]|nr:hypothetical protein [SAR324 cluster bacterium]
MNCLSSICVARGNYQNPTYNLTEMLTFCSKFDKEFLNLNDDCSKLDAVQDVSLIKEEKDTPSPAEHYRTALHAFKECHNLIIKLKIRPMCNDKFSSLQLLWLKLMR